MHKNLNLAMPIKNQRMKINPLFFLVAMALLSSCKTRHFSRNNKQVAKQINKITPNAQSYTALSYIDAFKEAAIEEMNKTGIPASITLAQGILESGAGNSELARNANNHFGIKCGAEWGGKVYYKDDDQKNECFRVYKDARESYRDHSEFLKRKRYVSLFFLDKNDYKSWASGLKAAGYATNPKYPDLLINTIEKYRLYQYDQPATEAQKTAEIEDRNYAQISSDVLKEKTKITPAETAPKYPSPAKTQASGNSTSDTGYYIVKQGDTLYGLSKIFKLTVDELKNLNQLQDNNIKIGQKLLVVK